MCTHYEISISLTLIKVPFQSVNNSCLSTNVQWDQDDISDALYFRKNEFLNLNVKALWSFEFNHIIFQNVNNSCLSTNVQWWDQDGRAYRDFKLQPKPRWSLNHRQELSKAALKNFLKCLADNITELLSITHHHYLHYHPRQAGPELALKGPRINKQINETTLP